MFGDKIQIRDINGQIEVDTSFEDIYDDRVYIVIDKQSLGETIGSELLDEDPEMDYDDNIDLIYKEINKQVINDLKADICICVQEYIENNQ